VSEPPLLKGGQGRDPEDLEGDAKWIIAVIVCAACLGGLYGAWCVLMGGGG
jgi:hypothetical protein